MAEPSIKGFFFSYLPYHICLCISSCSNTSLFVYNQLTEISIYNEISVNIFKNTISHQELLGTLYWIGGDHLFFYGFFKSTNCTVDSQVNICI